MIHVRARVAGRHVVRISYNPLYMLSETVCGVGVWFSRSKARVSKPRPSTLDPLYAVARDQNGRNLPARRLSGAPAASLYIVHKTTTPFPTRNAQAQRSTVNTLSTLVVVVVACLQRGGAACRCYSYHTAKGGSLRAF
eukprot:7106032-Prymnesium_polylepis.2